MALDLRNENNELTATSMLSGVATYLSKDGKNLGSLASALGGTLFAAIIFGPIRIINAIVGFGATLITSPTDAISGIVDAFILYPLSVITGEQFSAPGAAQLTTEALGNALSGFLQIGALPIAFGVIFVSYFIWIYYAEERETPDWLPIPGFPDLETPDFIENLGVPELGVTEEDEEEEE